MDLSLNLSIHVPTYLTMEMETDLKELACTIVGVGKSEICRVSWHVGDLGKRSHPRALLGSQQGHSEGRIPSS